MEDRSLTAECKAFAGFLNGVDADVIPHGWSRKIGVRANKNGKTYFRSRHVAQRLLSRIIFFYSPKPVYDPETGALKGYVRRFAGPYWVLNQKRMAEELGCSRRTLIDELELLRQLGLIETKPSRDKTPADGLKNVPLFVVPNAKNIMKITKRASEDSSHLASEDSSHLASEDSSHLPVKILHSSNIPNPITSTNLPGAAPSASAGKDHALFFGFDRKGQSVPQNDNSQVNYARALLEKTKYFTDESHRQFCIDVLHCIEWMANVMKPGAWAKNCKNALRFFGTNLDELRRVGEYCQMCGFTPTTPDGLVSFGISLRNNPSQFDRKKHEIAGTGKSKRRIEQMEYVE